MASIPQRSARSLAKGELQCREVDRGGWLPPHRCENERLLPRGGQAGGAHGFRSRLGCRRRMRPRGHRRSPPSGSKHLGAASTRAYGRRAACRRHPPERASLERTFLDRLRHGEERSHLRGLGDRIRRPCPAQGRRFLARGDGRVETAALPVGGPSGGRRAGVARALGLGSDRDRASGRPCKGYPDLPTKPALSSSAE